MSRDVEICKQRHISLKFTEFPNQSPPLTMGGIINEFERYLWIQLFEKNTFQAWGMLLSAPFDDYIAAKAGVILPPNFTDYAIL